MTPKVPGYSVGRPLGAGSAALVFEAQSEARERSVGVALKIARPGMSSVLLREARLLARLGPARRPRVSILAAGFADDGAFCFAMPRALGATLPEVIARHERGSLFRTVALGVASALSELHALGYAHGDVKPENILVSPAGDTVTLLDYGLAAPFGEPLTAGTPAYLPPNAQLVSPENDLYALGLVLGTISPGAELATALSHPSPGLRPSADAVLRTVEAAPGQASARSYEDVLRLAYLSLRADEIHAGAIVYADLQGPSRAWLEQAIAWEVAFAGRDVESATRTEILPLSSFRRRRWLVSVFGHRAAAAEIPDEPEGALVERMVRLTARDAPASVSVLALSGEGAAYMQDARASAESPAGLTARLVRGTISDEELRACEANPALDADLQLEVVRHLLALGAFPRALLALHDRADTEATLLRAEMLRRSGAPREALSLLNAPHQGMGEGAGDADVRILAAAARAHWDLGEDEEAKRLATRAGDYEVLALSAYRASAYEAGEREVERGLLTRRTDRSRLLGIRGMLRHARGQARESMAAFSAALDASRSLLEEASYGTGLAAAASDAGAVGIALDAATRASLQWESLGRPTQAARALLARAATLLLVASTAEASESLLAARALARRAGDTLTECYAELGLAETEAPDVHLERARILAAALKGEPVLRVLCTRIVLQPESVSPTELRRGDEAASVATDVLRIEWWGARARALAGADGTVGENANDALRVLREIAALLDAPASLAVRGPAIAAALVLAKGLGESALAQRLSAELATMASTLTTDLPARYRATAEGVPWISASRAGAAENALSPVQMAEFGRIAARFGGRESLRELFTEVLDAMLLWTSAERGVVLTRMQDTLMPRASRNVRREELRGEQLVLSKSLAEEALRTRRPVVATDAFATLGDARASIHALKLRSVLAVPLLARGEVFGVVYLDDRSRRDAFGPKELAWVNLLAVQAACAIADARDQLLLRRALRRAERARTELAEVLSEREGELAFAKRELREVTRATVHTYDAISGSSREMSTLLRLVDRVTDTDVPVLLLGESGTGKELVARAIHENGARSKHAFVTENCASVPENLLESTLFGHVRGAFTGASGTRAGLLDLADRGTLFLDEIGEMPIGMQGKLLRVLQDGLVRPVGSDRTRKVDVRVIAATNRDLPKMVKEGTFRADLFYRLDVATLRIPALRERADDIPGLVHHFIQKYGEGRPVTITPAAVKALARKPWPGNVRQLENEIRKLLLFAGDRIDVTDLSESLDAQEEGAEAVDAFDLPGRVDALETELVQRALRKVHGNQTKAAELLRISRFGLQKMMKRLGIVIER